jgi:hypothetical protein
MPPKFKDRHALPVSLPDVVPHATLSPKYQDASLLKMSVVKKDKIA